MIRIFKNNYLPLLVSIFLITITTIPLIFLNEDKRVRWLIFPIVGFRGIGIAIGLNIAT